MLDFSYITNKKTTQIIGVLKVALKAFITIINKHVLMANLPKRQMGIATAQLEKGHCYIVMFGSFTPENQFLKVGIFTI